MRWKGLGFINVQSYEDNYIPLNPNGLTVIEAKNETGKSVYIKCLRLAIFFKYATPKQRKVIIKRPYVEGKVGIFYIDLVDNTRVTFEFRLTYVTTIVKTPDGEEKSYRGDVPLYVTDMLGLVIDYRACLILNIMDNESPMLFDSTDPKYNDNLLGFYAKHDDLVSRKEYLEDELSSIQKQMAQNNSGIEAFTRRLSNIYVEDYTDELNSAEEKLTKLDELITGIETVEPILNNYLNLLKDSDKPVYDCTLLEELHSKIENISFLENILACISELQVELNTYNTTELESIHKTIKDLDELYNLIDCVSRVVDRSPVVEEDVISELTSITNKIKDIDVIYDIVNKIRVLDFDKKNVVADTTVNELEGILKSIKDVDALSNLIKSVYECYEGIREHERVAEELRFKLETTMKSFGRCALCGQEIKEVNI